MGHSKDILWKGLLEWVFDDLLRFVFADADAVFDMEKGFDYMDKELEELNPELERSIDVRFVDKLVKAYRRDGKEEWVLVHIEVQDKTKSKDRPLFPERMFRYFYRCFDRYRRSVAAIAIFCGPDGKKLPGRYEYSFLDTRLQYEYTTLRLLDFSDAELANSTNPFAWVLLAAKDALKRGKNLDEQLLQGKLFVFRKLYENGVFERRKLQAILTFLHKYVQFGNRESYRIFNEEIDKITHKAKTMDIFEQVAEIRAEERAVEIVENLLKQNLLSVTEIAEATGVSESEVKAVQRALKKMKKR